MSELAAIDAMLDSMDYVEVARGVMALLDAETRGAVSAKDADVRIHRIARGPAHEPCERCS
jgi:hypothetical protein